MSTTEPGMLTPATAASDPYDDFVAELQAINNNFKPQDPTNIDMDVFNSTQGDGRQNYYAALKAAQPNLMSAEDSIQAIEELLTKYGYDDAESLKTSVKGSKNDTYMNLGIGNHIYNTGAYNPSGGSSRDVDFTNAWKTDIGSSSLGESGDDASIFGAKGFQIGAALLAPVTGGLSVVAQKAAAAADGDTLHAEDYKKAAASVIGAQGGDWLSGTAGLSPEMADALVNIGTDTLATGDFKGALGNELLGQGIDWGRGQLSDYMGRISDPEGWQNSLADNELGTPGFTEGGDYFSDNNYYDQLRGSAPMIGDTQVKHGEDWHWEQDPDSVSGWKVVPNDEQPRLETGGGGGSGGPLESTMPDDPFEVPTGVPEDKWVWDGNVLHNPQTGEQREVSNPAGLETGKEYTGDAEPIRTPQEDPEFSLPNFPQDPAEPSSGTGGGTGGGTGTGEGAGEGTGTGVGTGTSNTPIADSLGSEDIALAEMPWLRQTENLRFMYPTGMMKR